VKYDVPLVALMLLAPLVAAGDKRTDREGEGSDGWVMLFDGNRRHWMTDKGQPSARGSRSFFFYFRCINPNKAALTSGPQGAVGGLRPGPRLKISKGCNSGGSIRRSAGAAAGKKRVPFNGIEGQIMDSQRDRLPRNGAIYTWSSRARTP